MINYFDKDKSTFSNNIRLWQKTVVDDELQADDFEFKVGNILCRMRERALSYMKNNFVSLPKTQFEG
jgi:hypothetical protein